MVHFSSFNSFMENGTIKCRSHSIFVIVNKNSLGFKIRDSRFKISFPTIRCWRSIAGSHEDFTNCYGPHTTYIQNIDLKPICSVEDPDKA